MRTDNGEMVGELLLSASCALDGIVPRADEIDLASVNGLGLICGKQPIQWKRVPTA